jgi:hypothetical protein
MDIKTALEEETNPLGLDADPSASRLLVSNLDLLTSILKHPESRKQETSTHTASRKQRIILSIARGPSGLTFMDDFVLGCPTPSSRAVYISSVLCLCAAQKFAFGSQRLLMLLIFVADSAKTWFVLKGVAAISRRYTYSLLPAGNLGFDSQFAVLAGTVVGYFLVLKGMTWLRGLILR